MITFQSTTDSPISLLIVGDLGEIARHFAFGHIYEHRITRCEKFFFRENITSLLPMQRMSYVCSNTDMTHFVTQISFSQKKNRIVAVRSFF